MTSSRFPQVLHREVGATADVEASTQPSENHGPAVARRIAEPGENGFEDLRRLAYLTLVQQLLATLALGDVPLLRGSPVQCLIGGIAHLTARRSFGSLPARG